MLLQLLGQPIVARCKLIAAAIRWDERGQKIDIRLAFAEPGLETEVRRRRQKSSDLLDVAQRLLGRQLCGNMGPNQVKKLENRKRHADDYAS